jgi:hypothetical protein
MWKECSREWREVEDPSGGIEYAAAVLAVNAVLINQNGTPTTTSRSVSRFRHFMMVIQMEWDIPLVLLLLIAFE